MLARGCGGGDSIVFESVLHERLARGGGGGAERFEFAGGAGEPALYFARAGFRAEGGGDGSAVGRGCGEDHGRACARESRFLPGGDEEDAWGHDACAGWGILFISEDRGDDGFVLILQGIVNGDACRDRAGGCVRGGRRR